MNGEIPRVEATEIDTATMPTLDVRKHRGKQQIRGALYYDAHALLKVDKLALPLPHENTIVVYGDTEEDAERVAARLREQGYEKAAVLSGGIEAWESLDLPLEAITEEQPIPGTEAGTPRI